MDLSIQCERTIADETESNKGSKVFNHLTSGNDNEYVEGDPVCSSLAANVKERLVLKSTANGLVNGTLNDNSDCSIKVIKTKGDKSEDCLENPHRNSRTVVQEPHKAETICTSEELSETKYAIDYVGYESEKQMPDIMRLIQKDLSEPYSIYTYRYFIHNWPKLCFLAMFQGECIGAIVCKLDFHRKVAKRGYIAMLAVDEKYRKQKIGSKLVQLAIQGMVNDKADEVVLETEITNQPALRLYENLGFVRDKRLFRYYLNGVDALRLKLWLR